MAAKKAIEAMAAIIEENSGNGNEGEKQCGEMK